MNDLDLELRSHSWEKAKASVPIILQSLQSWMDFDKVLGLALMIFIFIYSWFDLSHGSNVEGGEYPI